MKENSTYSHLQVWRSAQHVSQKIFNLVNYFPEEEVPELAEGIRNTAKSLPELVAEESMEDEHLKTLTSYNRSLDLLNSLEEALIHAFDQSCITERELKTTLEAISIYSHQLRKYQKAGKDEHLLMNHLSKNVPRSFS